MGINLYPVGNHTVDFANRTLEAVAEAVAARLQHSPLPNAEALQRYARLRAEQQAKWDKQPPDYSVANQTTWTYELQPAGERWPVSPVYLRGPYGLEVDLCPGGRLEFHDPPFRFHQAVEMAVTRAGDWEIWRTYFRAVVTILGGDTVYYLHDHGDMQQFAYEPLPFTELTAGLAENYGPPTAFLDLYTLLFENKIKHCAAYAVAQFDKCR